jgi:integrase
MQSALRVFLRFCYKQKYIQQELAISVPTLRTYKLAKIPHVMSEEDIQKMLDHIDRSTNVGRRDYAIILMLATYGIRSKQIRKLRVGDIDWRKNQIYFPSMKFGKDILQPLTPDVGEALLDYLQNSRCKCSYSEVFLTVLGPYKPINNASTISSIIARRARAAGISLPKASPHALRYAFASRMLKNGHSLKSVADMLGHRCFQTTFIYTKVDFQSLCQVPLEWPEEVS